MYCHYCGRPAGGTCAACHHRICPAHRRQWLFLPVCLKCRSAMWFGTASAAAALVGAAAVYFMAFRG
ncbi:MAG TPA: hypothetical protein VH120_00935, partial [Gemmataceae bacterium]|jgi:hypothetical protein|nr:hypothetical protein [Gemmataceae bacterium]